MDILHTFGDMSGQDVSEGKTNILFSKKVPRRTREILVQISKFREILDIDKYLGVPLKREDYKYILDQIENKLAGWKAKQLSFAGRIMLAKSVIEAKLVYPMMTNILPKAYVDEIQKYKETLCGETLTILGVIML